MFDLRARRCGRSAARMRSGRRLTTVVVLALWSAACSRSELPDGAAQEVRTGHSMQRDPTQPGITGEYSIDGASSAPSGDTAGSTGPAGVGPVAQAGGDSKAAVSGPAAPRAAEGGTRTGVTKGTISISVSSLFSGPYEAVTTKAFENGTMTWVNEVNAKGGIHGRKIEVVKVDNQGTGEGGVAACKEAQGNGTFTVLATFTSDAEIDCLDHAGIPAIAGSGDRLVEPWRWARGVLSTPMWGAAVADFAKGNLGASGKVLGLIKVSYPNYEAISGEFTETAKRLGLSVKRTDTVAQNQATFISELSRMRSAGVQMVVVVGGTEMLGILRDARAIGYQPIFTGAGWAVDELSQVAGNLMDGLMTPRYFGTAESPAFKAFRAEAARQGRSAVTTTDALAYGQSKILGHILELAGPDLTRESFTVTADRTTYETGLVQPVQWRPGNAIGARAFFPVVCCNPDSTWKSMGPPQERF